MTAKRPFIPALTGVRFVAALMVLIGHGATILPKGDPGWTVASFIEQEASIGMSLFFTLSGMVIWINYAEMFRGRAVGDAVYRFAVARFARLYPMYFCTILLALGVGGLQAPLHRLPWSGLFFLMLQAWVPGGSGRMAIESIDWAGHLWSVSAEMLFYMLFPVIVPMVWRLRSRTQIACAMLVNLLAFSTLYYLAFRFGPKFMQWLSPTLGHGDDGMQWLTYYSPYLHILEFIAGCLVGAAFMQGGSIPVGPTERTLAFPAAVLLILGFVTLPIFSFLAQYAPSASWERYLRFFDRGGSFILFPFLLVHISRYQTFLSRVLQSPLMVLGGEASYSIYLLHPILISGFSFHIGDTYPPAPGEFFFRLVLLVCMATVLSWGSYMLVERPARAWLRQALSNLRPERTAPVAAQTEAASD